MKFRIRRVLVAIRDPEHTSLSQLRKAAAIARAADASIELFHVITEPEILEPAGREPVADTMMRKLERIQRSPVFRNVRVESFVEHGYPVYEAIAHRARQIRADLVVAAPGARRLGSRLLLRNSDWELIRHCPCALLLVKTSGTYDRPAVLAAVDPTHAFGKPTDLDPRLLESAGLMGTLLRGKTFAFHAYLPLATALAMPVGPPMVGWLAPEVEELHQAEVSERFGKLADAAGIPAARRLLEPGEVKAELTRAIRKTGARIVVMGAISRGALKRLVIGSTAERVLDSLTCDVLIVKPEPAESASIKRIATERPKAA